MSKADEPARIAELRDLLTRANRAYYVDADPIMSDTEFDRLLDELAELERRHPELADPASPTVRVGGEPIEGFVTRDHALPMMSIDNTYNEAEVRAWVERVTKTLKDKGWPKAEADRFVCDPKVDGVAVSLRYEKGELAYALTRGDGTSGDDVTHAVRTVRAIPLRLDASKKRLPDVLEIRGELFIPLSQFARINRERAEKGDAALMNPRNATAGTIKMLDPSVAADRKLGFVAHGRGEVDDGFAGSFTEFMGKIRAMGVAVSPMVTTARDAEAVLAAIEAFNADRHDLDYLTDGMVVRVNRFEQQEALGYTSKSPRWAIAYKYAAERATTVLFGVEHQVGKTGKITPRATMEPVLLAGTTVRHATLHNYGSVLRKDICIGDTVEVEKAGEIIPYVLSVVSTKRPRDAQPVIPPESCPICNGPVEIEYDSNRLADIADWPSLPFKLRAYRARLKRQTDEYNKLQRQPDVDRDKLQAQSDAIERTLGKIDNTERRIAAGKPLPISEKDETARICINPECPAQISEKLLWFSGRKQMDIEGFGESVLTLIRSETDIPMNHFADIFRLSKNRASLEKLPGMGPRSVEILLNGIETAKTRGLARVLTGMGIRHVGETTAKSLAKLFPNLDALLAADELELRPKTLLVGEAKERGLPKDSKDRPETGLGKITAPVVYAYLHSDVAKRAFDGLREVGVDLTSKDFIDPETRAALVNKYNAFGGRTFVMTGTLEHFERKTLSDILESLGAKTSSAVSRFTDVVVAGEKAGSKLDKARELGVEIWDEARLLEELPAEHRGG